MTMEKKREKEEKEKEKEKEKMKLGASAKQTPRYLLLFLPSCIISTLYSLLLCGL
jgi:hypothetical protein